jgi:hypothetical protein
MNLSLIQLLLLIHHIFAFGGGGMPGMGGGGGMPGMGGGGGMPGGGGGMPGGGGSKFSIIYCLIILVNMRLYPYLTFFFFLSFLFSVPGGGGGGMGGMKSMMRGMMGGMGGGGGGGGMKNMMKNMGGGGGMDSQMARMHLPHLTLRQLLKDMEVVAKRKGHDTKTMKMLDALKHQILDKVSCVTNCMHHKNEHGLCYEQSCAFHYQPGNTEEHVPTICADELSFMALTEEAEGLIRFGVHAYPIEPDDDMLPTQLYDHMPLKNKYRKRLGDGTEVEASTRVCHNSSCAEHPPPTEINAGDTLYVTLIAIGLDGEFRHLHPGSFRVLAFGSQTGASCSGGVVGPGGLGSLLLRRKSKKNIVEGGT